MAGKIDDILATMGIQQGRFTYIRILPVPGASEVSLTNKD